MRLWWLLLACTPVNRQLDPGPLAVASTQTEAGVSAEGRGWLLRARVAEERGDLEEAERAWGWVLRLEPKFAASWVAWGRFLERQRRDQEASEAYEEALVRDPSWSPAHLHLGDLLVRAGHLKEASRHLEKALEGGEREAYEVLGRLYVRLDDAEALSSLVDRWLTEPEASVEERMRRASAALDAGRPEAAVDDLVVVVEERDDPLVAELLVEAALRSCRQSHVATEAARLGLDRDPAYASAMARLAASVASPEPPCDAGSSPEPR
ncbi:MAG: tetratricopeptide repeat protein [Deltaproteobacteria bacterium]|nr:MAG: tetratricopeptide repeat protein [Deltaproteobacteria bacterium]